jgi:alginate O-acetyltransferase complex protein AlgI
MLFHSFLFIFAFLPGVLLLHVLARKFASARAAQLVLLVASLVFYARANPAHVPVLVGSLLFNFRLAHAMAAAEAPARRRWLVIGLTGNVLLLGTLKYARFACSIVTGLTGLDLPVPPGLFPLGLSFFTIQQIMYLVDCYEGLVAPHGLLDHASFVASFPTLTSGPLTRSRQMLPQLRSGGQASAEDFGRGLVLFGLGLFKKVVIADCIARFPDASFSNVATVSGLEAWLSAGIYCLQIYFDFSGYSDMAVGAGRMLGLKVPVNFNAPYRATSIIEFWQRWHITLSQFITTYLYTPLIRSFGKATLAKASIATLLAMTLAGLWHGPAWTYVVFGCIHGAALVVNQVWRKKVKVRLPPAVSWPLTMAVVLVGFVVFRSPDLHTAWSMARALVTARSWFGLGAFRSVIRLADLQILAIPIVLAGPLAVLGPDSNELANRFQPGRSVVVGATAMFLLALLYLNSTIAQDFVYFAF